MLRRGRTEIRPGNTGCFTTRAKRSIAPRALAEQLPYEGRSENLRESVLGTAQEITSEDSHESCICHLDRSLDGAMRIRGRDTDCQGRSRPVAVDCHRERSTVQAHCRSASPRTAVTRSGLYPVSDGEPSHRPGVWQRRSRSVAT